MKALSPLEFQCTAPVVPRGVSVSSSVSDGENAVPLTLCALSLSLSLAFSRSLSRSLALSLSHTHAHKLTNTNTNTHTHTRAHTHTNTHTHTLHTHRIEDLPDIDRLEGYDDDMECDPPADYYEAYAKNEANILRLHKFVAAYLADTGRDGFSIGPEDEVYVFLLL